MPKFEPGAVRVVASDTSAVLADFDRAYLSGLRLATSILETFDGSGMPASQSQRVYRTMQSGFDRIIEGRGEIVSVVAQLQVIQRNSNCAEVAVGCPWPWSTTTGETRSEANFSTASTDAEAS